jgi:hypothetical protein
MGVAVMAIGGAALASAAVADQGGASGGKRIEVEPRFELVGSHGYRLLISAREAMVSIGVGRGSNTETAGTSTTYIARGTSGAHGIHADFRQFGRVDVTFHRTAPAGRGLPPDCFGNWSRAKTVPGYFTGTVDFEGEDGYTVVHAHRVRGEEVLPPAGQCPWVAGGVNPLLEDPNLEVPPANLRMSLLAIDKTPTGGLEFFARRVGKSGFWAERWETKGRIGLLGVAYAIGPAAGFTSDPQVSHGVVHPPAPFTGSGFLRRSATGKRSWTGTLAAPFPGQGSVTLVGPDLHTTLSRSFP